MLRIRDRARGGNPRGGPSYSVNLFSATLPVESVYSRTGDATDVNSMTGVMSDYPANTPRISAENGYLAEKARTNSIRNGEAGGGTVGVIGSGGALPTNWSLVNALGVTVEVIAQGTVSGFKYIDLRISGTALAGTASVLFESTSQITAANAQVWAGSAWFGLIGGTLTNAALSLRVSERNAGSELAGSSVSFTPTIDMVRRTHTRVLNNASTSAVVSQLDMALSAGSVDFTLRISSPQLEQGYGATSYIRTTSAAASRGDDVLYIPAANISGLNINEGTFAASGVTADDYRTDRGMVQLSAGDGSVHRNEISHLSNGFWNFKCVYNFGLPVDLLFGQMTTNRNVVKAAARWKVNDAAAVRDNGTVATDTSFPTMIPADRLYIGTSSFGSPKSPFNGYIYSVDIYNVALSNAQLKTITT